MSTRACVAYTDTKQKWVGVYSHYDGYPEGLGKTIWNILHKDFINNKGEIGVMNDKNPENAINAFIEIYIKGHQGGWSSFGKECYCHSPAFVMRDGISDTIRTNDNVDPLSIEYIYIIDKKKKEMIILENKEFKKAGENEWGKIIDYKHCIYGYKLLTKIDLLGKEPDWENL